MDWENCVNEGTAVKVSINEERMRSLRNSAKATLEFVESVEMNENNASILLKNMYDAVLELLHAYLLSKGYKVLNHLCIGYYLRDVLGNREFFYLFDRYRKIRNSITYYGVRVEPATAKHGINELGELFGKINGMI
ncbi:MAG: hypothetical protein HY051_00670 [Candidatus Aenigmarchaeota archaeon]|nr:hypothetical protein [Candidatus Aenigmarchaeota archaeon]